MSENCPYDLIVDWEGNLYKIQVKTSQFCKNGTMTFYTSRTNPFKKTNEIYLDGEIDYFFLYCIEKAWCGIISIDESGTRELKIHYDFPLNHNFTGYKMQQDYEFDYKIDKIKKQIHVPLHDWKEILNNEIKEENNINKIDVIEGRTTRDKLKRQIRNMSFT